MLSIYSCVYCHLIWDSPGGSDGKESACNVGDSCLIPDQEDSLEKGMAKHSNILAWTIPWTEELVCYNLWDHKELDMTEQVTFHTSYLMNCLFKFLPIIIWLLDLRFLIFFVCSGYKSSDTCFVYFLQVSGWVFSVFQRSLLKCRPF